MTIKLDIVSQYSDKGTKKARKDMDSLTSTAKKLAGAFGVAFGIGAIKNFAAASVKAYADDARAAKALELQLINTGNAFATSSVNEYIASLERTYHVLDDQLRPAYQTLLTSTGSVLDTQKALNVALDISAATGKDLQSVSLALARGYTGQTTAIQRLGVGIDKATLASGDMNKILDVLSTKFRGQASAAADSYQGKINALGVASANVQEIIGKSLIDSLSLLGKDDSITTLTGEMEKFALQVGDAVYGLSLMLSKLEKLGGIIPKGEASGFLMAIPVVGAYIEALAEYGAKERAKLTAPKSNFTYSLGSGAESEIAASKQKQIEAQRLKIQQQQLKVQQKSLKAQQDQAKLKKGQGLLDIDQAGILAALQGKITENEKIRLELQLALLTGNAKEADRLSNALLISQAQTTGLASFISNLPKALNPFADYPAYVTMALAELAKLAAAQKSLQVSPQAAPMKTLEQARSEAVTGVARVNEIYTDLMSKINATNKDNAPAVQNNYTINGATSGLIAEIQNGLINLSASGDKSSINRTRFFD
jgi:hypothetical protein